MDKKITADPTSRQASILKKVEDYLKRAVESEYFSGVIMVVDHGTVILHQAYGMATIDDKNIQSTIFHVGSITKQFTAAAIMKLWEEGKIDVQVSINHYLPQEFQSAVWDKVTVHHLLSHTSGIVDYGEKYYDPKTIGFCFGKTLEQMIKETGQKQLEFEPGTQWNYCNIGYTLLGIILERQTGYTYSELIKKYFLVPLGMLSTSFHEENYSAQKRHAAGFRWDQKHKKFVDDDSEKIVGTIEDGGMLTTAEDLYKWSAVIAGKRPNILSNEIVQKMITPIQNMSTPYGGYGYGLGIDDSLGTRKIHHSGWIVGFTSEFCLYPENDIVIIVLCNNTTANTSKMIDDLTKIVL